MSIPVISVASATAAALLDAAVLIEQSGAGGLYVTCCEDRITIWAGARTGDAGERAAVVAALGKLAGAARRPGWKPPARPAAPSSRSPRS